jgi:L-ascorbate metabolism protein UlaG (beta-lactamase superfamily)
VDEAEVARRFAGLDAVFVGHAHHDHAMDVPAVARASPGARLVGGGVVGELLRRLDVEPHRCEPARDGARFVVGPFTVEALGSRHGRVPWIRHFDRVHLPPAGVPRTPFRYPRGEVFAWRVEVGDRVIHLHGSAGIDDHVLARQAPADVLVACLAARGGTPRYLERLAARLTPRVLVPCHHDDFFRPLAEPPRPVRTLDWAAFLRDAAALGRAHGTRLWLPPRGVACAW